MITLLLLVCATTAYAQEGTISLKGRTVNAGEAMRSIESQTAYKFSYNRNIYDTTKLINVEDTRLPLRVLLDSMVAGANVKYMIHGQYIAFVPANDNSRPQVQRPLTPRTADAYARNNPHDLSADPVQRPVTKTVVEVAPQPEIVAEPEKPQYSDYHPIDIYGDVQTSLPRFALKINLLYGIATLTPNISAEVALSKRSTLELSYSNNPWKYKADLDDNKKFLHGIASLEYRYWFCERFSGHFLGIHGFYSEYNISGYDVPLLFEKEYRYKGNAYGGGVLYGYALPIGKMWNIEFTAGVDVFRMDYDRYRCVTCDRPGEPFKKTKVAPSAGINIVFLIK